MPMMVVTIISIVSYGIVAEPRLELGWISAYEADEMPISPLCINYSYTNVVANAFMEYLD